MYIHQTVGHSWYVTGVFSGKEIKDFQGTEIKKKKVTFPLVCVVPDWETLLNHPVHSLFLIVLTCTEEMLCGPFESFIPLPSTLGMNVLQCARLGKCPANCRRLIYKLDSPLLISIQVDSICSYFT